MILNHNLDYEIFEDKTVLYTQLGGDSITILDSWEKVLKNTNMNLLVIEKYWKSFFTNPLSLLKRLKNILIILFKYIFRRK